MAVLITGVGGMLGKNLAIRLLDQNETIIGIDNLATGQKQNIQHLLKQTNFLFIETDLTKVNFELNQRMFSNVKEIYHLASPASPKSYMNLPLETIKVNTVGTENLLKLAKALQAKVLYASTSEVYGDPLEHPQSENYLGNVNTWGPRACYDESKRLGEVYCYLYNELHGVKVTVARIFNTYSADLKRNDGRVISNFISQALSGEDITIYGDGTQTRSFCYVEDTIRGLHRMMKKDEANAKIFNIGNPDEHSIKTIAQKIIQITNTKSQIIFQPLPKDDPQKRCPDISKAKQLLGWEPIVSLEEGLRKTIDEYKRQSQ